MSAVSAMNRLSPGIRRVLALAVLVLAVFLPYRLLVEPVLATFDELSTSAAEREEQLVKFRRLAESREALEARLDALKSRPMAQEGYLSGDSETLVAAQLQTTVRTLVERSGGKLESTQVLAASAEGDFRRVSLRVRMSADSNSLFRTIYELEAAVPYLFIENFDVLSRESRGRRDEAAGAMVLSVAYDVYGYLRAG